MSSGYKEMDLANQGYQMKALYKESMIKYLIISKGCKILKAMLITHNLTSLCQMRTC